MERSYTMDIRTERDAHLFTALWAVAEKDGREGAGPRYSRKGIARRVARAAGDLGRSLAIMDAAPTRYTVCAREDMREAIAYLRHGFHPYAESAAA
jgi:hypothetical protein